MITVWFVLQFQIILILLIIEKCLGTFISIYIMLLFIIFRSNYNSLSPTQDAQTYKEVG